MPESTRVVSQAIQANLSAEHLPSPPLRGNFKFRGSPRGVIPAGQEIPTIIAIEHDDAGFRVMHELLRTLPRGSRVGLEYDDEQTLDREEQKEAVKLRDSFTALALAAEELGLEPIRLERVFAHRTSKDRATMIQISRIQRLAEAASLPAEREWLIDVQVSRLYGRLGRFVGCGPYEGISTSAWRSDLMAREIARRGDWKATDVVITGAAHAVNLARIFETKVAIAVGRCTSSDDFERLMKRVMEGQSVLHQSLERRRDLNRLIFAVRHPVRHLQRMLHVKRAEQPTEPRS